jgi:hypothetical protein
MLDEASVQAVDAARWSTRFVKPLYDSYGLAQIPWLIESLFTGGDTLVARRLLGPLAGSYDRVILLFIDAFGWQFFIQYHGRYPFLRRMMNEGVVMKLTSQFPSTTAAHTTTIHTGLTVGQSGVYEWFYYEPLLDAIIAPLVFSFAGDKERNTLMRTGITPDRLFPQTTLYQHLRRQGVKSFVFQSRSFTPSPFGTVVCAGAQVMPFATLHRGLRDLAAMVLAEKERSYFFLYSGDIDSAGHHHGPNSSQFVGEVDACFTLLESTLHAPLKGNLKNTLLLMTADHGQIEADPRTTIFLNETLPEIVNWLKTDRHGRPIPPAGFCRDAFLHVREACLEEAHDRLHEHLAGRAEVYLVQDLIDQGFFGSAAPSETFLKRVGNLVVLPYEEEIVWWYDQNYYIPEFIGYHGGLTPPEMETILLALAYE